MTAIGTVIRVLRDPVVRAIVIPLVESLVAWVQGGRRPGWLDGALREVPGLDAPVQLAEAKRRARR
jgi:hypothetical protein